MASFLQIHAQIGNDGLFCYILTSKSDFEMVFKIWLRNVVDVFLVLETQTPSLSINTQIHSIIFRFLKTALVT